MLYRSSIGLHPVLRRSFKSKWVPFAFASQPAFRLRTFSSTLITKAALARSAIFEAVQQHDPDSTAVVHSLSGRSFSYRSLLHDVAETKARLTILIGEDLASKSIGFLIENSYDYVVTLLALFASNARAVPLSPSFPAAELRYFLNQSGSIALLSSSRYDALALSAVSDGSDEQIRHLHVGKLLSGSTEKDIVHFTGDTEAAGGGLMLYTSGTTARPKGVLLDQDVLMAQAKSLLKAWKYSPADRLLHVLPLHHIHGIVNAIIAPLLAGSTIEFTYPFTPDNVWKRLAAPFLPSTASSNNAKPPITILTAVPTIWSRLLHAYPTLPPDMQTAAKEALRPQNLRLNMSGSAALPVPVKQAWTELSNGNVLLERYGMTEVGMALSCGLAHEDRIDGSVGWPLPSVNVRLVDSESGDVIPVGSEGDGRSATERAGEIQLHGPTIFKGYWRDEEATKKEFTSDGWFKTGDVAVRKFVAGGVGLGKSGDWARGPAYFILGRASADIIKMGGEKISALEVERELLSLPEIQECAVVALPSETWGQKVAAVIVLSEAGKKGGERRKAWGAMDMRRALKGRMAAYKMPQVVKLVDQIPRNAMGKVNKKELVASVFAGQDAVQGEDSNESIPG